MQMRIPSMHFCLTNGTGRSVYMPLKRGSGERCKARLAKPSPIGPSPLRVGFKVREGFCQRLN